MALIIKDGAGSTTSLKTTLTGSDHMPHHVVQAVSGTVQVTSSVSSPVYVTGNVSINQPINVDIDLSDKLTVVVSGTANVTSSQANPVYISSSIENPTAVYLTDVNTGYTTGAGTGKSAFLVYLTGAAGNKVEIKDLTLDNGKVPVTSSYANPIYAVGLMNVTTSVNSPVLAQINNDNADEAFTAISQSFAENSIKVKLTGSNTVKEGAYDILLVRGTGSDAYVSNAGFNQAIFALTGSFTGDSLKVKITGSNVVNEGGYDLVLAKTVSGSQTTINNTSFGQVLDFITSSYDASNNVGKFNVQLTGASTVNIGNVPYVTASILNFPSVQSVALSGNTTIFDAGTNSTGSAVGLIGTNNYVTLYNSTSSVTSSKNNPVFVVSDTDKPVYVATTASLPIYVTSSTIFPLQIQTRQTTDVQKQRYVANIYGFDWTVNSGTVVFAYADINRKSLMISNPSPHDLYISVGSGSDNGFLFQSITTPPETYSFIIYPSGTYTADEYAANSFHAGFYVSQSDNSAIKTLVTRIGY